MIEYVTGSISAALVLDDDVPEFIHPSSLTVLNSYRCNRRVNHSGPFDCIARPKLREVVDRCGSSSFLRGDEDVALAHLRGLSRRAVERELFDIRPRHQSARR